jgi:hypothetical protein
VPFTIFQRLSSLGSGGGVKGGTVPPGNARPGLAFVVALKSSPSGLLLL